MQVTLISQIHTYKGTKIEIWACLCSVFRQLAFTCSFLFECFLAGQLNFTIPKLFIEILESLISNQLWAAMLHPSHDSAAPTLNIAYMCNYYS